MNWISWVSQLTLVLASCEVLQKYEEFKMDDVSESVSRVANKPVE